MFPQINSVQIQDPFITPETESFTDFLNTSSVVRQSQSKKSNWDRLVMSAMEVASAVNPYESDLPFGTVVPAISALDWSIGRHNCDLRPRLIDKSTGEARLVDSGSMITATKRLSDDKEDHALNLVAVNGSRIKTYGTRTINVKINRKNYPMKAVICDIEQDILGMDFLTKFRLGFEWDDFNQTELYIVDRKAQIKSELPSSHSPNRPTED